MAPPSADAGERGFGFRHFSPHSGWKMHRPQHRFEFHRSHSFGKHRHFKPRHFAQPGFALSFRDGRFAFSFGHVPRFKPRHFHPRHGRGAVFLRFGHPWHTKPWRHRGPAFGLHRQVIRPGPVLSQSTLEQLEALGFREVPRLLADHPGWSAMTPRQPAR
jgi:hypothetical protein